MGQQMYTLLACLMIGSPSSLQLGYEHISLFVRVGEHFGTVYTSPPAGGADFVIFQGEPIKVELEIFNEGSKEAVVVTGGIAPKDAFHMVVVEAPMPKVKTRLSLEVSPSVKLRLTNAEMSTHWSEQIVLPPQSGLKFKAMVVSDSERLPTGIYKLKFRSLLKSASGKDIPANNDTFTFEIRAVETFEDRLEVLIREATWLFVREKYQEAEKKINELLLLYPNSAASYGMKGFIARVRGRKEEAVKAYKKALDLLRSKNDTIYLSHASSVEVEHVIGTLLATLRSLQKSK
ncbi:MAG: tetratricopeptide repeat protein [Acidobacteria bacterium]|nr:MAG: tetratricopeptide repeat protein [Acidobacteriota bacterium]